jgi:putative transposase
LGNASEGHGFSRADIRLQFRRALAPEGRFDRTQSSQLWDVLCHDSDLDAEVTLEVDELAKLLERTVYEYRVRQQYLLHEFIVMKDHVHLIITPTGISLERAMQLIKGGFSRHIGQISRKTEVWQRGFNDHRIREAEDYFRHREYIHLNPVRAGMCSGQEEYLYSSANPMYKKDPIPQRLRPVSLESGRHG